MRRVDYGGNHGNDWVYPGGAVDPGESLDQTARREVLEEAGIVLDKRLRDKHNRQFCSCKNVTKCSIIKT